MASPSTSVGQTLSFLFTDIEGSTALWEQHPEAMKLALARHDEILRQSIERHGGQVFKTAGDAFYTVFASAPAALLAALDAQRAIGRGDLQEQGDHKGRPYDFFIRVRMALHSGVAEQRDNDYFGPALNRVARLLAAGYGGQILISSATEELLRDHLPEGVSLRDMGEWRLKDLTRLEHIYQLISPDLPAAFPPLKALETLHTNLPAQLTSFVGREKEISAIKTLVANNRLSTLTGSGGTGKTRLSLHVAANLLDVFPNGVWFVELAPLTDPALIAHTVMTALGLHEEPGRTQMDILVDYFRDKTALLILDNCEHLVDASAQLAATLLSNCPTLHLLASSRESLGLIGEAVYRVPSLSTPNLREAPSIENLMHYEAVHLFVDRAKMAQPDFAITNENALSVAQICARLDGIPLAIELAAARVKILRVEQIAERLDDRFRLLTGGSRTALPRQQTLRALIDWSYDLLTITERSLLGRLSVFSGGWTLEAAETVCKDEVKSQKDEETLNSSDFILLTSDLVNKSLVVVNANDGTEARYGMLETVRQYAREKLAETKDGLKIRDQHLQYFAGLAQRAERELTGPRQDAWLERLEYEVDNIRAALEWSLSGNAQIGLQMACALQRFWSESSYARDGRSWLVEFLKHPALRGPSVLRAKALGILGLWDYSRATIQESLTMCRALDDLSGAAFNLVNLGFLDIEENNPQGQQLLTEGLTLYRALDNQQGIASALITLGRVIGAAKDYERAYACIEEGLAIARKIEYTVGIVDALTNLGMMSRRQSDYAVARIRLNEVLSIEAKMGRRGTSILNTLHDMGQLSYWDGDYAQARAYYERCLSIIKERKFRWETSWIRVRLGYAALRQGDAPYARKIFLESIQEFKSSTGINNKVGTLYTLEGQASLAVLQGQYTQAAQLFAYADVTRAAIRDGRPPNEQSEVERDLARIRAALGAAAFDAAQSTGRAMRADEAIACAVAATDN